jgi:hypothetical protein
LPNLEIEAPLVTALKATKGTNLLGQAKDKHADRDAEQLLCSAWAWEKETGNWKSADPVLLEFQHGMRFH